MLEVGFSWVPRGFLQFSLTNLLNSVFSLGILLGNGCIFLDSSRYLTIVCPIFLDRIFLSMVSVGYCFERIWIRFQVLKRLENKILNRANQK